MTGSLLLQFNADKWLKMFGTSTHCVPCDKDCIEEFDGRIPNHEQRKSNNDLEEEIIPQDVQVDIFCWNQSKCLAREKSNLKHH